MGSASHFQRSPGLDDQAGSFPNWIGSDLGPDLMAQIQLGAVPKSGPVMHIWAYLRLLGWSKWAARDLFWILFHFRPIGTAQFDIGTIH